jgi:hypothetical protein
LNICEQSAKENNKVLRKTTEWSTTICTFLLITVMASKSKRMSWTGHAACNAYVFLANLLGRHQFGWEDDTEINGPQRML